MTSGLSISGAASGLDTASIIDSLIRVESNQQTLLKNRVTKATEAKDALTSLLTDSRNLATQARSVANTALWTGVSASSSSANVKATATGTFASQLKFNVTALAKTHSLVTASSVATTSATVATSDLTFTPTPGGVSGSPVTIPYGDGSLATVVNNINAADVGVKASAVLVATGEYKLQVVAASSGTASQFTLTGIANMGAVNVLSTGANATLSVGDTTPYTITSSTNTFAGLMPGLTVTVSKVENDVTVETTTDGSTVAAQVDTLVKNANTLLANIAAATKYDPANKTGGPLVGSNVARSLQQSVLSAVSGSGAPGIAVQRDGTLTFDSAAFVTAYNANPASVAGKFGASVTASGGMAGNATLVRGGDLTVAGSYTVAVTTSAEVDKWTVTPDTPGDVSGQTLTLTRGATTITSSGHSTALAMVNDVNTQAAALGFGVTASVDGSTIVLTADSYGSASNFTATYSDGSPGIAHTSTGRDIVGSIDGKTSTGYGRVLTVDSDQGAASGLALSISAGSLTSGTVTYSTGVAQGLLQVVAAASSTVGGLLTTAANGLDTTVKDLQAMVDAWTTRLAERRAALVRQFTAMELALQKLKSAGSSITSATTAAQSDSN